MLCCWKLEKRCNINTCLIARWRLQRSLPIYRQKVTSETRFVSLTIKRHQKRSKKRKANDVLNRQAPTLYIPLVPAFVFNEAKLYLIVYKPCCLKHVKGAWPDGGLLAWLEINVTHGLMMCDCLPLV